MPRFPDQYRFPPNLARIRLHLQDGGGSNADSGKVASFKDRLFIIMVSSGGEWCAQKVDFPVIYLEYPSKELEEWIVEEGSMPCLRSLVIDDCKKLKELPDGLKYITSLKELEIKT
ncbi:unnamed protein product [Microthlaspi erraticum]|uniref:R13L1/DRL21-like LRR repeat region domain-containing protein n=1 Tax=Microthlaspi erraticum TaxID=1685480 RepID=A0A6D2I7I5_9BRAS|nr:unnamed protein product [Microthlaspi erraticum]